MLATALCSLLVAASGFSTPSARLQSSSPPVHHRARAITLASDDKGTAGKGFDLDARVEASKAAAEVRGRVALEEMRAANSAANPAYTDAKDDAPPIELPENAALGLAGFFIVAGIGALVVGGPVWESTNVSPEESMKAADNSPAFGFVPTKP